MAWVLAGLWAVAPVGADDAAETFEALFGREVLAAKASRESDDDLALARELLVAARTSRAYPQLLELLLQNAWELSADLEDGGETALAAMTLLGEALPARAVTARSRIVKLHQRQYNAGRGRARRDAADRLIDAWIALTEAQGNDGDWVAAKKSMGKALTVAKLSLPRRQRELTAAVKLLAARRAAWEEISRHAAALKADGSDRKARRELIRLYVVVMDNPRAALSYLEGADEMSRTYVPLAAESPAHLSEAALLELGRWYAHLAEKANETTRLPSLRRARGYLQALLARHGVDDGPVGEARKILAEIEPQIWRLLGLVLEEGHAYELLTYVDLAQDAVRGSWRQGEDRLVFRGGASGRLVPPAETTGQYELTVTFVRRSGGGGVGLVLPVRDRAVRLVLDEAGRSGLELIDGKTAHDNTTTVRDFSVVRNRPYRLTVRTGAKGGEATVAVTVNKRKLVQWRGDAASLSIPGNRRLQGAGMFAVDVPPGQVEFGSIKLRIIDGLAKRVR